MLKVVNSLFRLYIGRYSRELRLHYEDPVALQRATLNHILRRHRRTVFGREHDFTGLLKHPDRFATSLPVLPYEGHLPYLGRVLRGERDVLAGDEPAWVATTSGTTGSTKYLPYSNYAVRKMHLKGSWMSLACLYAKDPNVQVFSTKNLLIGGAFKGHHPGCGLPQGDISAIIIRSIPNVMRSFYIPDLELATSAGYEEKIERIAHLAAAEPGITVLGGVPTWNLPLYKRILELHGGDTLLDVWPGARVFKHGGVNFAPYRDQFEQLFPAGDFIFQEIYNATEGFFGVQDRDDLRTILLILNAGVYYEFIPWEDFQAGATNAVPLGEVRVGVTYVMLITTMAGLYRYPMGDLLKFTETNPYRLQILGRTQEFINAFGEDLLRSEAEGALLTTCELLGGTVRDFTVAPEYRTLAGVGRHHWVIEFSTPPPDPVLFTVKLDEQLQSVNYNYRAKRGNDFGIARQTVTIAPSGTFASWLKAKGKQGGQHKVPRLVNHRRVLDEVLSVISTGV